MVKGQHNNAPLIHLLIMVHYKFLHYITLHQGIDRPVDVVIAAHCRQQKLIGSHHSGDVWRSTQRRMGVMGRIM